MVLGTTSGAGKSWLATALCRWYAREGFKVAPFKAQNMSNNARVVEGGEIGSAQYFQALAAGVTPNVLMNPVLLKPEADTRSQVVMLGKVNRRLSRMGWLNRSGHVWPAVKSSLNKLLFSHDIVVIEGAGSPAEINLMANDIVNLRVARHARARCLLVTDIDRGGAFAHLYGTWKLLKKGDQKRIHGFVLNKFRGEASLLKPGPEKLQKLTGVPTVATLPMWREHGLPEEDGIYEEYLSQKPLPPRWGNPPPSPSPTPPLRLGGSAKVRVAERGEGIKTVAIVYYPRISNLDEFQPLRNFPGVRLRWAENARDISGADWVILPGSKHTSSDLAWMRVRGLDRAVSAHASAGKAVLGICGGLQMLGKTLRDPHHVEGGGEGLGLLPLVTEFKRVKTVRPRQACFGAVSGSWTSLSGLTVQGYEIHNGNTWLDGSRDAARPIMSENLAWQNKKGNVLGLYLHGLFEDASALRALFGIDAPVWDHVFDGMADFVDRHFQPGILNSLVKAHS